MNDCKNCSVKGIKCGKYKSVSCKTTREIFVDSYNQAVRDVLNGLNADGFFCGNEVEDYLLERYLK